MDSLIHVVVAQLRSSTGRTLQISLNKCWRSNLDELGDADDVEGQGDAGSRAVGGQGEERVLLGEPPEVRPKEGGGRRGVLVDEPPEESLERGGELGVGRVENGQLDELLPQDVHGGGRERVLFG